MMHARTLVAGLMASLVAAAAPAAQVPFATHAAQGPPSAGKHVASPERAVVGVAEPLSVVPDLSAEAAGRSTPFWTHSIQVPGATFLKAHVVALDLRPGDTLVLRSGSGRVVDTLSGRGPKGRGSFWALSAFGDQLHFELAYARPYATPPFRVDQVIVGRADLFAPPEPTESVCPPEDFDDAICFQSDAAKWNNVLASVGVMFVGGTPATALLCSGSNVSPESLVLTNDHCIPSEAACDVVEFVFRYYATGCNDGSPPTRDWESFRCDEILASSPVGACDATPDNLDFALCSVDGAPAASFGFVRPDATPLVDGEDIYMVQHPAGRPHEITHGGGPDVDVDGTVLRYTATLDTEGGSSGSPIFREADDAMVGLHHCGGCEDPGVWNRGMLMSDIHPHIARYLCTEDLGFAPAEADAPTELAGNGDAVIDPGETWQVFPRLTNVACEAAALDVTATARVAPVSAPFVSLLADEAVFGDLLPGQTATSLTPIVFHVGEGTRCGGTANLDLLRVSPGAGAPLDAVPRFAQIPIGHEPLTTLLYEDFAGDTSDWTVVDSGAGTGPASTWTTDNPGNRPLPLAEPFMIADSDAHGAFVMDERLISPIVDASGYDRVLLQFTHDFNAFPLGGDEQADVDVRSSATGGAFIEVVHFEDEDASGTVVYDISQYAVGQTDVQIRFHYHDADFDWWWAVDDVYVLGSNGYACAQVGPWADMGGGVGGALGEPVQTGEGTLLVGDPVTLTLANVLPMTTAFLVYGAEVDALPFKGGVMVPRPDFVIALPTFAGGSTTIGSIWPDGGSPGFTVYFQWWVVDPTAPAGYAGSNALAATIP